MTGAPASERKPESGSRRRSARVTDARGRRVRQFDPVRAHLVKRRALIPAETLDAIVDDLMPGMRKKKLIQIFSVALSFLFVIGGNLLYFASSGTWKGLDPVNTTIYLVQIAVLLSGPLIAFRIAKSEYAGRISAAMLKRLRCPHCAYDIRNLPRDPSDAATVCPECGCAWLLAKDGAASST